MRKVRCPRCGVINMEGFLAYPFCAGCGVSLPQVEKVEANAWQRPVRATFVAAIVGISILALLLVGMNFLDLKENSQGELLVFGSTPDKVRLNENFPVRLTLTREDLPDSSSLTLHNVAVRVAGDIQTNFKIAEFDPAPTGYFLRERGIYYVYPTLPSPQLQMRLQARRTGTQRIDIRIYVQDEQQGQYLKTVEVLPPSPAPEK